jgi:hypothetical protein
MQMPENQHGLRKEACNFDKRERQRNLKCLHSLPTRPRPRAVSLQEKAHLVSLSRNKPLPSFWQFFWQEIDLNTQE